MIPAVPVTKMESVGMIPVRGAVGYGRERGDVRNSVGSGDITAIEEARGAGVEVVRMIETLSAGRAR